MFLLGKLRTALSNRRLRRRTRGRFVFRYHDGRRLLAADPSAVFQSLDGSGDVIRELVEANAAFRDAAPADRPDAARRRAEALRAAVMASRKAFGVPPFAEGGLTDVEAVQLLTEFFEFTAAWNPPAPAGEVAAVGTAAEAAAAP